MKEQIIKAKKLISPYIKNIPLYHSLYLSELFSSDIYFKLECLQRTGSFKIRGALNAILNNINKCKNGVIAASAGNHAQGVAFGAKQQGIKAVIVMPEQTPLVKINNTKRHGADVILYGKSYDEAQLHSEILAKKEKLHLIHPFNDNDVIAGQGTIGYEILEELPDVDNIIVPVGGGGLASGISCFVKESNSKCNIIGVQSEKITGMTTSIKNKKITNVIGTPGIAEGIAVKSVGDITFSLCLKYLDDIVTVSENKIAASILEYLENSKIIVEGAGATPLAAILSEKVNFKNKKNVLVVSGGNIDINMISRIINKGLASSGRFLKLSLILKDIPGTLSDITSFLGKLEANILDINHNRYIDSLPVGYTKVEFGLETKSKEHIEYIFTELEKAGYDIAIK